MIVKIIHILKGWGKSLGVVSISTAEAKLSELRLSICGGCKLSKVSEMLEFMNGGAEYVNTLKCTKCKCPCKQKSLVVDESCPVKKW